VSSNQGISVNLKNLNTSCGQQKMFNDNGSKINIEKDIMKKGTYDPPPSPVSSNNQMFPPALSRVPSLCADSPMQPDKNGQKISGKKYAGRGISVAPSTQFYDQNKSRKNSPLRMRLNQDYDNLKTNGFFESR